MPRPTRDVCHQGRNSDRGRGCRSVSRDGRPERITIGPAGVTVTYMNALLLAAALTVGQPDPYSLLVSRLCTLLELVEREPVVMEWPQKRDETVRRIIREFPQEPIGRFLRVGPLHR